MQGGQGPHRGESVFARWLWGGTLVLTTILLAFSPALPQTREPVPDEAAAQLITAALFQYFDPSSVFQVTVFGASIAGDSLRLETVHIDGRPAVLHGFRAALLAHLTDVELDAAGMAAQQVRVRRVRKATIVLEATARDVEAGLTGLSPRLLHPKVVLGDGQFEIAATVVRGQKLYPAVARGRLRIEGGQRVIVLVTRATVSGDDVPPHLVESELAKLNPVVDLSRWPLGLRIQRAVLSRGKVEFLLTAGE